MKANDLLKIIKEKYTTNGEKYGAHIFDYSKFLDRYDSAVQQKIDDKIFLEGELCAINDFLLRIEQKENQKPAVSPTDQILSEYASRLEKYQKVEISGNAQPEIEYLLGCMIDFNQEYLEPFLKYLHFIKNKEARQYAITLENIQYELMIQKKGKLPKCFLEYQYRISKLQSGDEIERMGHVVLKSAIQFLNTLKQALYLLQDNKNDVTIPGKNLISGIDSIDNFLDLCRKHIEQIVFDFRLKGLI